MSPEPQTKKVDPAWTIEDTRAKYKYPVGGAQKTLPIVDIPQGQENIPFRKLLPEGINEAALRFPDGTIVVQCSRLSGNHFFITNL